TLSDPTFAALQALAKPFVDTPEDVIKRLLQLPGAKGGAPTPTSPPSVTSPPTIYNPLTPPDLTHTKLISAAFMGATLLKQETYWNTLLNKVVLAAQAKVPNYADLKKVVLVNIVPGKKEDEGYRYLKDADISVQGQDANSSWKAIHHIVVTLGMSVD